MMISDFWLRSVGKGFGETAYFYFMGAGQPNKNMGVRASKMFRVGGESRGSVVRNGHKLEGVWRCCFKSN